MKLYLIRQSENLHYNTFDSAVVAARNADSARQMHPGGSEGYADWTRNAYKLSCWAHPDKVIVEYLGEAEPSQDAEDIILASYHAG